MDQQACKPDLTTFSEVFHVKLKEKFSDDLCSDTRSHVHEQTCCTQQVILNLLHNNV